MGVVIYLAKQKAKRRKQDPLVVAFRRLHRDIAKMGPIIDRLESELTRDAVRQEHKEHAATPPESAT